MTVFFFLVVRDFCFVWFLGDVCRGCSCGLVVRDILVVVYRVVWLPVIFAVFDRVVWLQGIFAVVDRMYD